MPRKRKPDRPRATGSTRASSGRKRDSTRSGQETELRIIGGHFRGSKLAYHGDPIVRPMKHRTREAIFDLVGPDVQGRHAIDLFAGTGALGLEALSRGATSATFIEKHVPSARIVAENVATLEVGDRAQQFVTSAFVWAKRDMTSPTSAARLTSTSSVEASSPKSPPAGVPWLVFCSPPYAFFVDRLPEMLDLISRIQRHAPPDSLVVVEADERFDFGRLTSNPLAWSIRTYAPAVIGIWRRS
jgi:16S rRNA (guanine966-N2)-methyltransferase